MKYTLSMDVFTHGKMFNSSGKFFHKIGNKIKLFPYITGTSDDAIIDLSPLIGAVLCGIEDVKPAQISPDELINNLEENTDIEPGDEDLFKETMQTLFFDSQDRIRPLSLKMLEQIPCDDNARCRDLVKYLVDVLGNKQELKDSLQDSHKNSLNSGNVLEKLVLSHLEGSTIFNKKDQLTKTDIPYFRVINSLNRVFVSDFKYVIQNQRRAKEYLVKLFEFYYFTYTAQTILQLNRFFEGEREKIVPLYFCLNWEKTSQSRRCFERGWQVLQRSTEKMFAHVVTLELLNHTSDESVKVDYIGLKEIVDANLNSDGKIAEEIIQLTEVYKQLITDCNKEMNEIELHNENSGTSKTAEAVKYLFNHVKTQFENSTRERAYNSYSSKFENFCKEKFLKKRGRSGWMLNLSEETLIFLTKLSIKDKPQLHLKEVFREMEARGIYLDDLSKDQAANYYEKLNLIEKKSDSGDAKYVKRIL